MKQAQQSKRFAADNAKQKYDRCPQCIYIVVEANDVSRK
jgi:hypothetical protein